jgi:hypothetical protein
LFFFINRIESISQRANIEFWQSHSKEDAYKMKKFFKPADKEKEKSKIIELTSEVKWEDIADIYEEVDINGEEKEKVGDTSDEKVTDASEKKGIQAEAAKEELKKKKKKGKKK